jgi:hypothetical protein
VHKPHITWESLREREERGRVKVLGASDMIAMFCSRECEKRYIDFLWLVYRYVEREMNAAKVKKRRGGCCG